MSKTKSFYAIIPATVRYNENLNANAKLLYGEITALCNEQGFCWANNQYFADLYKVRKEAVSRWISALEAENFITSEVDQADGNKRKIFIVEGMKGYRQKTQEVLRKNARPSYEKTQDPLTKKRKHNNTINNTEREERALDFLKLNFPSRFETFLQQNKSQIKDFKKFELDFNDTCDQEQLEYNDRVLFGRLGKYARNWIENQNKFQPKQEDNSAPTYLRKIL